MRYFENGDRESSDWIAVDEENPTTEPDERRGCSKLEPSEKDAYNNKDDAGFESVDELLMGLDDSYEKMERLDEKVSNTKVLSVDLSPTRYSADIGFQGSDEDSDEDVKPLKRFKVDIYNDSEEGNKYKLKTRSAPEEKVGENSSSSIRKRKAGPARKKCGHCRQILSEATLFTAGPGSSEVDVLNDPNINIEMDDDDDGALQYKLTNFTVYDKLSNGESHLVPIFADSLLMRGKKIYFSGQVLRLDMPEEESGLEVVDIGPITQWTNLTGMDGSQEQIILNTRCKKRDVEYNLVCPSDEYRPLYENTYRMNGSTISMPRLASSTLLLLQGLNKSNPKQGTQIVE